MHDPKGLHYIYEIAKRLRLEYLRRLGAGGWQLNLIPRFLFGPAHGMRWHSS
jgi:hypothetical protein